MRFLIAESETAEQRQQRRENVGKSSGETFGATLLQLAPGATLSRVTPADADAQVYAPEQLERFDAVFLSGAPVHVYDNSPEVDRQLDFMRAVFASRTPSFGSCAGLQVAVAAAGGTVRKMNGKEAGVARRIVPTDAGRDHPLLAGRGLVWDAPAIHDDEVAELPDGAVLLATSSTTRVQAAEVRHAGGIFWGVQYHPELSLAEIAAALRRQAQDLVETGLALTTASVEQQAALFDALDLRPERNDVRWQLGVDGELADQDRRRTELRNFITHLVVPTRQSRGRGV